MDRHSVREQPVIFNFQRCNLGLAGVVWGNHHATLLVIYDVAKRVAQLHKGNMRTCAVHLIDDSLAP